MDKKKILFVSGEVWPFVKTGGLGDVAYSLPKELKKLGAEVRVILPKYDQIPWHYKKDMVHLGHKTIELGWRQEYLGIEMLVLEGVTYYFVDNMKYFCRSKIYGEGDDCERFAFFCKSVIESFDLTAFYPDIIHCNDWHTGMVPVYLDEQKRHGHFGNIKTMFTIHNLRFQGVFPYSDLEWTLGLDPKQYFYEDGVKFINSLSFMKGGV
ncbi:MAG: glycogen synthase, partial [Fusobacteriaceae bacterium]